jgi:8-oxo-dGTP pyrophosphatase MutT (NUDIX family)
LNEVADLSPIQRFDIPDLLAGHRPSTRVEGDHRRRMQALAVSAGDPFSRSRFDPGHFTVSAFVLSADGTSLLMIYHDKLERWLQPGGHVEPSDSDLCAAARREVVEETGLPAGAIEDLPPAPFDLDIHAIPGHATEPGHLHHDLRYLFRSRKASSDPTGGTHDVRWVALDDVLALNPEPAMKRVLEKLRAVSGTRNQEEA